MTNIYFNSDILKKTHTFFLAIFFILLMVFPFQFYGFKTVIFGLAIIFTLSFSTFKISRTLIILFTIFFLHGIFFILLGYSFYNAVDESFLYTGPLYVAYPLFYLLLTIIISSNKDFIDFLLNHLMRLALLFCIFYIFYLIGAYFGYYELAGIFLNDYEGYTNVSLEDTDFQIKYHGLTSMAFLGPFCVSQYFVNAKPSLFLKVLILLSIVAIILCGRRAIILSMLLTPIISSLVCWVYGKKERSLVIIKKFGLFLILITIIVFSVQQTRDLIITYLTNFDFSKSGGDISVSIRYDQYTALLDGWLEEPFFGKGHGVPAEYIREGKPWRYELSYLALLFHTGIVGFVVYAIGVIWIYSKLYSQYRLLKDDNIINIVVGLTSILIVYSTNPYLDAFDVQWTFYLSIFFINSKINETTISA